MEERLLELLFELSSSERMAIMLELLNNASKLSQLSQKLGLTAPEASRHLQRLGDAGLIQRGADGLYGVTPFGKLMLSQLSGLDFAVKQKEYFQDYDVFCLPYEFINRLGELAEGKVFDEPFRTLEETARSFREAEEYVWIISDKNLSLLSPGMAEKLKGGPFDLKIILPAEEYYPEKVAPIPSKTPGIQKRVLPKVEFRVVVTEKIAGISLPHRSNSLDYGALIGSDPKLHKWCRDLFMYYWDKSEPYLPK